MLKFLPQFILFEGDAGVTGNGNLDNTSTGEGEAGNTGNGGDAGTTPTEGDTSGSSSGASTFTQADMDRVAGQVRKEALERTAKEMGFDSYKSMADAAKAQREADDAAKSDLEKAQAATVQATQRAEQVEQRMYNTLLRSKFELTAVAQVADIDLAYLAAREAGLLSSDAGITVDVDTGQVTGLDKAIEKLLKDKPLLKKTSQAAAASTGGNEGGNTPAAGELTDDKKAAYRRRFGIR